MQFLPCAMLCQNSSRFLACGNWPDIPITAMGCQEWATSGAGTLPNRAALRLRQDFSFSPVSFVAIVRAILGWDEGLFFDPTPTPEDPLSLYTMPFLSPSSCTLRPNCPIVASLYTF